MTGTMLEIDGRTIGEVFGAAADTFADNDFLCVPRDLERRYDADGRRITFAAAGRLVGEWREALSAAAYGHGHRIAVLLENRPEMLIVKLACAMLGISWVPINPDYRAAEMAYVLRDSGADLAIAVPEHADLVRAAIAEAGTDIECWLFDGTPDGLPRARTAVPIAGGVDPQTEASLLYTSGTTGRPKGCILGHEYELMMGAWYASRGGRMTIGVGCERVYNPLPLFHVNAAIAQFYGMLVTGNCQIIPERFSRSRWWPEVRETRATGCHYLGVVIPVLMNEPPGPGDREHGLKWGFGAGVEPTLHRAFEERFGFPLVEGWGMTEMCRILVDTEEPRQVDTRAMGRPGPELEVRVVDADDCDVVPGEPGEMVVRHSAETPRKGAFSGYLNQPEATEDAWRGGWFHTGDTVRQDQTGMLYFVDRKKNIIRRSGENIAAAEIEACLQAHAAVAQVAVVAVADEMRDEEVFACIVANERQPGSELAREIFDYCFAELAYYKAPGWILFMDELPVTGTQKIQKHMIFGDGVDPCTLTGVHDFRALKKRSV